MSIDVFTQHFSTIEDPRQSAKISYPLFDVLFLTICAVIAGCEGWEEIEDFGVSRSDWLKGKGLFNDGLPVHDTIARIVSCIEPCQLQRCFVSWMRSVSKTLDGEVIAIDGKTLRGSYNRDDRRSTIHMVSAFATANGVVMGQVKTAEKSNEITAIPELLELLDLKGCLVYCQNQCLSFGIAYCDVQEGIPTHLSISDPDNPYSQSSQEYDDFERGWTQRLKRMPTSWSYGGGSCRRMTLAEKYRDNPSTRNQQLAINGYARAKYK